MVCFDKKSYFSFYIVTVMFYIIGRSFVFLVLFLENYQKNGKNIFRSIKLMKNIEIWSILKKDKFLDRKTANLV